MNRRPLIFTLALAGLAPAAAFAQPGAFRHSPTACFGEKNPLQFVNLNTLGSTFPDWAAKSVYGVAEQKVFCPVAIHVPLTLGKSVEGARIAYSTLAPFDIKDATNNPVKHIPVIPSCSAFVSDGSSGGTWSRDSPAVSTAPADNGEHNPGNTGGLLNERLIIIRGGVSVAMAGTGLTRALVTCQIPKTIVPFEGLPAVSTVLLKGYEITYF